MACGHYSVVCRLEKEHIVLQDPSIGLRRRVPRKGFLNVWFDFKNVFPKQADDLVIRRMIVVAPGAYFGTRRRMRSAQKISQAEQGITSRALGTVLTSRR